VELRAHFGLGESVECRQHCFGGTVCQVPVLTPDHLARLCSRLCEARERHLQRLPVGEIVDLLDAAAAAWLRPEHPRRVLALQALPQVTGYSPPMVAWALDQALGSLQRESLVPWLREELGDPGVLDEFRPRRSAPGRWRALGPRLTTHFLAGNIPGLGLPALSQSLLVKSACLLKLPSGEPVLTPLFLETLAELEPSIGTCLAAAWWPGGTPDLEAAAMRQAEVVTATGDDTSVAALRGLVPPGARFLAHGHKVSFGLVGSEHRNGATAAEAAQDVAAHDQRGCLSPHLLYVEGSLGEAEEFAGRLYEALRRMEASLPSGERSVGELSSLQQSRALWELQGAHLWPSDPAQAPPTVVLLQDSSLELSPLGRAVLVKPIAHLEHLALDPATALSLQAFAGHIQTIGLAMDEPRRSRVAEVLTGLLRPARLCSLGQMQQPPWGWFQDGLPPLTSYLRFASLEE
jgi:hypothetical protein